MTIREFFSKYKYQIGFISVLLAAVFFRTVAYPGHPGGLNQDEAAVGYDAWALLNYGIDRNGYTLPVHLFGWGSGQNALYAYLSMPFIKIFGLTPFSVRVVNWLFGLLSIIAVFAVVKRYKGYTAAIIAMTLTAIAPWHLMFSRWGLEGNLFPPMFILSFWVLLKAFDKHYFFIIASALFALTLYSYGPAYLVVTLFYTAAWLYVFFKKLIPPSFCWWGGAVYALASWPIYLFVFVNLFHLGDVTLGPLSIPQTYGDRLTALVGFTFSGVLQNMWRLLVLQNDQFIHNTLPGHGAFFLVSLPFWLYGLFLVWKEKDVISTLLKLWFACSFLLLLIYINPNVNRVNILYLPLIIFTALGVFALWKYKKIFWLTVCVYLLCFIHFYKAYFGADYRAFIAHSFFASVEQAVDKATELAGPGGTVYITADAINMPYILVLFYKQIPPRRYLETVRFKYLQSPFQEVLGFEGYDFDVSGLWSGKAGVYIVDKEELLYPQALTDEVYEFENYWVAVVKPQK